MKESAGGFPERAKPPGNWMAPPASPRLQQLATLPRQKALRMSSLKRTLCSDAMSLNGNDVLLRGWVYRLRALAKTTFIVLRDCSGELQCVAATDRLGATALKLDDCVEIRGRIRAEARAKT